MRKTRRLPFSSLTKASYRVCLRTAAAARPAAVKRSETKSRDWRSLVSSYLVIHAKPQNTARMAAMISAAHTDHANPTSTVTLAAA
jgi:hypothetical protein